MEKRLFLTLLVNKKYLEPRSGHPAVTTPDIIQ